ncbi:hypothetical protein SLA2020_096850 [Shorea laevis]
MSPSATEEKPHQDKQLVQIFREYRHLNKRWDKVSSSVEHQLHMDSAVSVMTPLLAKLDLVGNLSNKSLHASAATFNGTILFQI